MKAGRMRVKRQFYILLIAVFWLLASCAGGGGDSSLPVWLESPPEDTVALTFWTAISEGAGEEETARQMAADQLLYSLFPEVGFHVDPNSFSGEAKELFDEYREQFRNLCLGTEGEQPEGVTLVEEVSSHRESGWMYAYLASADSFFLRNFSQDFFPFFDTPDETLQGLLDRAARREELGDLYSAMILYGEAGAYILDSDMVSKDYQYQEYADKVMELVSGITLTIEGGESELLLGKVPDTPYRINLSVPEEHVPFLKEAVVKLEFPESLSYGKVDSRILELKLDEYGSAEFSLGSLQQEGTFSIKVNLDPSPVILAFGDPDSDSKSYMKIARISNCLRSISAFVSLSVKANNKIIPTAVLILDTDITEKPFEDNFCERALLEALAAENYDVYPSDLEPSELLGRSDSGFLRDYKAQFGVELERLVYGIASLSDFDSKDNVYTASTSVILKVADIRTGAVISTQKISKTVESSDNQQVIKLAFRELGREAAREFTTKFP